MHGRRLAAELPAFFTRMSPLTVTVQEGLLSNLADKPGVSEHISG